MNVDAVFIGELENHLLKIDSSSLPSNDKLGRIGEKFVKEGIKYYFWEKGFCVNKTGNDTFNIGGPFKPSSGGMGGIDFRLEFRYNGIPYDCYIEVKNWKHYTKLSPAMFNTEILGRFTKNASQSVCIWIVIMNKRNAPLIQQGCQQHNIHIIPLEEHITSRFLNPADLTRIMELFLDEFSNLVDKITGVKLPNSAKKKGKTIPEQIEEDIRLGKPYSLIASSYTKSKFYVQKLAHNMKTTQNLPDRRTTEWDGMQLMTQDQVNDSPIIMMKPVIKKRKNRYSK
jgi:hypothetical protein